MNGGDGPVVPFIGQGTSILFGSEGAAVATSLLADWWWLWIPYLVFIVAVRLRSEVAGEIAGGLMVTVCGLLLLLTLTGESPQVAWIGAGLIAAAVVVTGVAGVVGGPRSGRTRRRVRGGHR